MGTRLGAMRGESGERERPQEIQAQWVWKSRQGKFLSSEVRTSIRSVFCHMCALLSTSNYNLVCPIQ